MQIMNKRVMLINNIKYIVSATTYNNFYRDVEDVEYKLEITPATNVFVDEIIKEQLKLEFLRKKERFIKGPGYVPSNNLAPVESHPAHPGMVAIQEMMRAYNG